MIGIDIEVIRDRPNRQAVAEAYFGPEEARLVRAGGDPTFLALWTIREAFGKATGQGIAAALALDGQHVSRALGSEHRFAALGTEWAVAHRERSGIQLALAWSVPDAELLRHAVERTELVLSATT